MNTQPTRFLDPKVDLAFKRIFGTRPHVLKSFLNALLPLPEDAPIESLEYLTSEQVPELPYLEKFSIVDVKCKDAKGRIFIVEMQMMWSASFGQRIVFGGSQAYVKQLKEGQGYESLQPVYSLALVNSIFEPNSTDYYHHYKIVKVGAEQRVLPWLQFVFIELPKFKPKTPTDKRMTGLWLKFLNEIGSAPEQTPDPQLSAEPEIAEALGMMQVSAFNEAELRAYNHSLDEWRTYKAFMHDKKAEGKAEGKAEIATAMKQKGMDASTIAELTGMSVPDIEKL